MKVSSRYRQTRRRGPTWAQRPTTNFTTPTSSPGERYAWLHFPGVGTKLRELVETVSELHYDYARGFESGVFGSSLHPPRRPLVRLVTNRCLRTLMSVSAGYPILYSYLYETVPTLGGYNLGGIKYASSLSMEEPLGRELTVPARPDKYRISAHFSLSTRTRRPAPILSNPWRRGRAGT